MKTITEKTSAGTYRGLDGAEVELSRREHGENTLPRAKSKSFFARFISNLSDPVIKILLFALAANIIFLFKSADIWETVGIAVSILLATLISTLSEAGSEAAYARLAAESANKKCRVRRNGAICEIQLSEIVVGDIVLLSAGDSVPADGLVISGRAGLDMSAMTGESAEVIKAPSADTSLTPSSPHFLRLSLPLGSDCRTRRSSRRPPWESPAATAQPAPAGPPVLGHLLEAHR